MKSLKHYITLLNIGGLILAALLVLVALWGEQRGSEAAGQTFIAKDVTADILPPPLYLIELRLVLSQVVEGSLPLTDAKKEVERLNKEYQERVAYWTAHPPYGLEATLLGRQHEGGKQFLIATQQVMGLLSAGAGHDAITASMADAHRIYLEHRAGVDATVLASNTFAAQSMVDFDAHAKTTKVVMLLVSGGAALVLLMLGLWVGRRITRPIHDAVRIAQAVAAGDLTSHIEANTRDETGQLLTALKTMNQNLINLVGTVRLSSNTVAAGSDDIAASNLDLSLRTEEQAANLQQTSSSMERLSSTVRVNAETANRAAQLAHSASLAATKGGTAVSEVVATMNDITTSSHKISNIIGVIDGIAFQTNILALNAAVEAARAGEQGRGFAVVASEVRSLAQRSAEAAKEIKALIGASVERVDAGSKQVDAAGATMNDIVTQVKGVAELIRQISEATHEQTDGIDYIGNAVSKLDQVTQQNAALVEESAAAAESLKHQADLLVASISAFQLEVSPAAAPHPDAKPRRPGHIAALQILHAHAGTAA